MAAGGGGGEEIDQVKLTSAAAAAAAVPSRRRGCCCGCSALLLLLLLLLLLQGFAAQVLANQGCENGHFTSVDCCDLCPPGYGVTLLCGSTNTKCELCKENVTFSPTASATEPCQSCSMCPGDVRTMAPCTPTHDTVCAISCPRGHYFRAGNGTRREGQCLPCQVCAKGYGAVKPCGPSANTVCRKCQDGYFSEEESASEPCHPCQLKCGSREVMIQACSPLSDTLCMVKGRLKNVQLQAVADLAVCLSHTAAHENGLSRGLIQSTPKGGDVPSMLAELNLGLHDSPSQSHSFTDKELQIQKRTNGEPRKEFPKRSSLVDSEGSVAPNSSSSSEFVPPLAEDTSKNIIPVYCSILAAVVVGLLAYVAFKCWSTCKQKQQLAKARAGEHATSPEGEKLHSDSGVFLDTHSLQEHHPQNKVHKIESRLYASLSPHRQEEVEQLLEAPGHGKDWRCLASHLGYEEETIDTFGRGEAPAHTLLSDWSSKEGATLEALCTVLAAIERVDVVENVNAPAEVSSVV